MISIQKLRVSTQEGHTLVSEISKEISSAKVFGIYGPNGSGKTSFLKTLAGIQEERKINGEVWISNLAMIHGALDPAKKVKNALYLGSDFQTSFHVTVRELLEMSQTISKLKKASIAEISEQFDLVPFLSRPFHELSDGEKQRSMLARGVLQSPHWLILDETFSKIDIDRSAVLAKVLRQFVQKGMGIVISSHDMNFLTEISDELWLMKEGALISAGSVEEVLIDENLKKLFPMREIHIVRSPEHGIKKVIY
jgi:iron complex transport system ATP-binding protein